MAARGKCKEGSRAAALMHSNQEGPRGTAIRLEYLLHQELGWPSLAPEPLPFSHVSSPASWSQRSPELSTGEGDLLEVCSVPLVGRKIGESLISL